MAAALRDNRWILDLAYGDTGQIAQEYLKLWPWLQDAQLNLAQDTQDTITWNLDPSGAYASRSAYNTQFSGATLSCYKEIFWKVWAPGKTKIMAWLLF